MPNKSVANCGTIATESRNTACSGRRGGGLAVAGSNPVTGQQNQSVSQESRANVLTRTISAALMIASLSSIGAAAAPPDAFDTCAQEKDAAARLACFDREIATRRGSAPAPAAPPPSTAATVPTAPAAPAPPRPTTVTPVAAATPTVSPAAQGAAAPAAAAANTDIGLDARQARKERRERGEPDPSRPAPIVARVVRVIPRQPLISAFELDNGQIWEQSEAMSFSAKADEQVTIRHGVLGAFFLKAADGSVVRAHRVK